MQIKCPAQLYTSHAKHSVEVTLDNTSGMISCFCPEQLETIIIDEDTRLTLAKHGWFLSDFWVTDAKNSSPLWKHKLTFYKSDGNKVEQALLAWSR
jgi:hypothetical protein